MSGIGGIVHWDDQPVELSQVRHMMQMVRHRGPDGLWYETRDRVGLGYALLATKISDLQYAHPVWLPDASLGIVADASIYNRSDILSQLGNVPWWQEAPSDAAIILAAYQRWGQDLLRHLDGDFAFAIWDRSRECVFAARDPFGGTPFFYHAGGNRFIFGSEPKQVLTVPGVPIEPDDIMIGVHLLRRYTQPDRTFFKGIRRLRPAHYLMASRERVVQKRWWYPDPEIEIYYKDPREYCDHFRELLKASVAKRLQTDYAVCAHLSGGFDSSSIVVMAEELYRQGTKELPPFETISAVYGPLPCDEAHFVEAVAKQVPFPSNTFNPLDEAFRLDGLEERTWWLDSPFKRIHPAFSNGCAGIMSQIGARVLLDGTGGDQVAQFHYDLGDLARNGRFKALTREAWLIRENSTKVFLRVLYGAMVGALPYSIEQQYRRLRKPKILKTPRWLTPEFAARLRQYKPAPVQQMPRFRSSRQNKILRLLNHPLFHWELETLEVLGSYLGYVPRLPYCDRALVEFVLAIPIEQRLQGVRWRYLHRCGLVGHLPREVIERKDQTYFTSYYVRVLAEAKPLLQEYLFTSPVWQSAPYIRKEEAERLFQEFNLQDAEDKYGDNSALWLIASLEPWLRQISLYSKHSRTTDNV